MWYYSTNGTQRGPFTDKAFLREVNDGRVAPDTLVWNDDLNEWRNARDVPGLLAPAEAASQAGAGLREMAEYSVFGSERPWNGAAPPPPAGSPAAQEALYRTNPHYEPNPSLLSFRGRMGRLRYALISIVIVVALFLGDVGATALVVMSLDVLSPVASIVLGTLALITILLMSALGVCTTIRRLHDLNRSGWLYWVLFVPFVNLLFVVYVLVAPGTDGPNRYGPVPS